jgi:hypothetical protein
MPNANQPWNSWSGDNASQSNKQYGSNWLSDFASNANKNSGYDFHGSGAPQNALVSSLYGQKSVPQQQPQNYSYSDNYGMPLEMPTESLASRYIRENPQASSAIGSSGLVDQVKTNTANAGGIFSQASNQMAAMANPYGDSSGDSINNSTYQAPDPVLYDESGDVINGKKKAPAAYDWSMDFG